MRRRRGRALHRRYGRSVGANMLHYKAFGLHVRYAHGQYSVDATDRNGHIHATVSDIDRADAIKKAKHCVDGLVAQGY